MTISPMDAGLAGKATVGDQKRRNQHLAGKSEAEFIALREALDRTLPMPKLILHTLQVNVRGGRLPEPERVERFVDAMFLEDVGRDERQVVKGLSEFRGHASRSNGHEANSGNGDRNL
jgi:hypothetical protein